MQRGEYSLTISHFYDEGYRLLFQQAESELNRATFEYLDTIANRIFFQAVGLHVSTGVTANIISSIDECHIARYLRGEPAGIGSVCVPNPEYCRSYPFSCNDRRAFYSPIMDATLTDTAIGRGSVSNAVSFWSGNTTSIGNSRNRSFVSYRGGANVFMLERQAFTGDTIISIYIHELAHTLNVPDHYCRRHPTEPMCSGGIYCWNPDCDPGPHRRPRTSTTCIMSDAGSTIPNIRDKYAHDLFCSYCLNDIVNHLTSNVTTLGRANGL